MLLCKLTYLGNLGFGHISGINAADRRALVVYLEHELLSAFTVQRKKAPQDLYDKFHRRIIIVKQEHLEHAGGLGLCPLRRKCRIAVSFLGHISYAAILTLSWLPMLAINATFSSLFC